jgi:hypothetical protein
MKPLKFQQSLIILALVGALTTSCTYDEEPKPGREVIKDYEFASFDRLEMGDAFNLVIEQGSEYSINVRGDERDMDNLVVEQDGEKLKFKFRRGVWFRHTRYATTVTIVMPALKGAELSGAVDATISTVIEDDFYLSLSGASTAHLNLTAKNVDFDLSGASDLDVVGAADNLNISLSGASTFKGLGFEVEAADVDASGASDVEVNASAVLKAHASGASSVIYRGTPVVNSSTSGSSSIKQE